MWKLVVNVTWSWRLASADSELSRNNLSWRLEGFFFLRVAGCFGVGCDLWPAEGRLTETRNHAWKVSGTQVSLSTQLHTFRRNFKKSAILNLVFLSHWENFNLKNDSKDPFNRKSSFGINYTSHLVWTKNYLESIQERVRLHGANEVWRLVLVFRLLV